MERMFEDDESTKKLMAEEIERLTKPPRMIRSQLRDHDLLRIQNEAGQGMLTIDVARWPSKPGGPATDVWQRGYRSRKAAFLKSPAILASKARLRQRRVARLKAMDIDLFGRPWKALRKDRFNEGHNNVLDDPGSGLSEREAERLQVRLKEIMDALEWKPVLGTQ